MGKPKNKNKRNQDEEFDDNEVDLDPLASTTPDDEKTSATSTKPAGKKKTKKKKDADWEDDIADEIKALSLQNNLNESEEEETEAVPIKKKEKKKKKKADSDEEEEMMKPKATFQMLMADDDMMQSGSDIEDDEEMETPVAEVPKETMVKTNKKKDKKKEKKDKQEEDIDALLAEIDKPSESKGKKKKKNKGDKEDKGEDKDAESNVVAEDKQEVDIEAKMDEVKVVSIDDFDDEEEDRKKKKKDKKKKGKKDEEQKTEEGEELNEGENEGEEEGESTVKTAAQKRKEKREREKLKKQQEKKKGKSKTDSAAAGSEDTKQEEDKQVEGEGDEEEEEKEGKKKKKKGEKEKEKKKSKAPVAAIKAQLQKIKEEEERLRREEEERIQKEEEEERKREEQKRIEEERKLKKKQKEKERKERLKKEGKLLSDKEKQDRRRAMQMLEQMQAKGVELPSKEESTENEVTTKKRPVYTNKKKKAQKLDVESTPSPSEEVKPIIPEPEVKEEVTNVKVDEVEDDLDIKDDWDAESEEEEEEVKEVAMETAKPEEDEKKEEVEEEEEEEEDDESEDDEDDDEDDDSDEEEDESEEESEDEDLTPLERARHRLQKYHEECEARRSVDKLRAAVVCVLGHVDTGKTKILDKLRRTNVQDGEAGGITQQIGATNVPESAVREQTKMVKEFAKAELKLPGLLIIDTPGHESFSNLRSRGSSLCDIAILVVDIMHGLEPQTIESLNLLKQRKTPFLIALNKIDRLYQWKTMPHTDVQNTIKKQSPHTRSEFEERAREAITQMAEQGINAALFYENKNQREYVSLVPTSAHTGDGMGNLIALICELTQTMLAKRVSYSEELQATVMEVKALPGLGTTIDVILVNGSVREGDQIIVPGTEGPICTHVRGLLMPQPMKELRVKSQWEHHKEVVAAQGVKIIAKDLEKALAGLPMYIAKKDDEVEYYKEELSTALKDVLGSIKLSERGVFVQASTLGSLEALLEFLRTSKIPYAGINIGPVHKKDIMKASVMIEHDLQYAVILAFDVKVEREAQEMADSVGVTIFTADIIYHLFDKFTKYREDFKKKKQEEFKHIAVFPCKIRVLPQFIFNSRDPIVVGVCVEAGFIREGTPICVPSKEFVELGRVMSVENNHKPIEKATKGMEVCIKIDPIPGDAPKMYGRHFDNTDMLYSKISRESIDAVKNYFRDEMTKADWQLIVEMKKLFQIL